MIEILFSHEFDSGVWNGVLPNGSAKIGRTILGELGLLDLLETQLGLKLPESPSYQRKIEYLQALRKADNKKRFYTQSLLTDPMAVTEHLLEMRDFLIEAGWGKNQIGSLNKINDLSEAEKGFNNKSGKSDRLSRVCSELSKRNSFEQISCITVMCGLESLSSVWRVMLKDYLPRLGVAVSFSQDETKIQADTKLDLGKLLVLRQKDALSEGDGSFTVLTGRDPWESARFVTAYLLKFSKEELSNTVIVAPAKHRGILMSAMLAQGIPYGGNHAEVSYSRPALQILILALALSWEPKDPSVALSLLTIEGSPVPKSFKNNMVWSLNESLAVGGDTWLKKLEEITIDLLEKAETKEDKEKIAARKQRIVDWFSSPAYSFEGGIPVDELVVTCGRVSKWLRQMWALKGQSSFREAHNLSELLANLAKSLGEATITRERMIHLLIDSIGDGIIADGTIAQSNGVRVVGHAGAIIQPVDSLIWWDFSSSAIRGFKESFFSKSEVQELAKNKIEWLDSEVQSICDAKYWTRPLSNTKSKALLVSQLLDSDGNSESFHPLLDEILPKKQRQKWMARVHVNLLEKQSQPVQKFLTLIGASQNNENQDHFVPRPEWEVQQNILELREAESSSSLEKLLGCELAYVLTYKAKLDGEDRASLQYDERIMGIIAHKVISLVFRKGATLLPSSAVSEAKKCIDEVIKDKAPQILQKERARELADLKQIILQDIESYAAFIQENALTIVDAELDVKKSEKTLAGIHLVGQIDHILADSDGKQIIMDHKFGGAKYKEKDLTEGKGLQLALYSKLLTGKDYPDVAYHIIKDRNILILNKSLNRSQQVIGPDSNEILLEAENKIAEKIKVLKAGKLMARGLDHENASERFAAPCRYCDYTLICGLAWKREDQ